MPDVKFCGITRAEDALAAARLGARYVGTILTGSPRQVTAAQSRNLGSLLQGTGVRMVGVFGHEHDDELLRRAADAMVDVVQLHSGEFAPRLAARIRSELGMEVWQVVRLGRGENGERGPLLAGDAEGVLLDALVPGTLGGAGVSFDWQLASMKARAIRAGRRLIVAGGLRPGNVRQAIEALSPDVVDVSSGVEAAPGLKDHDRMAEFMTAVLGGEAVRA